MSSNDGLESSPLGKVTAAEIRQQPELWPTTIERVASAGLDAFVRDRKVIVCGAGTSAYAASVVARGWSGALAIPTTDLLLCTKPELARLAAGFDTNGLVLSLARSGDSPESTGVIHRLQQLFPEVKHLAITCNKSGQLATLPGVRTIVLDPRTNDLGLAMTSSFSNLALAGLAVKNAPALREGLPGIVARVNRCLPNLEATAMRLASATISRVLVLTPPTMVPLAQEVSLKVLEMTGGRVVCMPETFLGVRHGPMSFLRSDSLVLCVLSSDHDKRPYELDLIHELQEKDLGKLVIVGPDGTPADLGNVVVPAMASEIADDLRTPFEIVFFQWLAYYLSLAFGLDPDNPSPSGIITRVVQRFRIHESKNR